MFIGPFWGAGARYIAPYHTRRHSATDSHDCLAIPSTGHPPAFVSPSVLAAPRALVLALLPIVSACDIGLNEFESEPPDPPPVTVLMNVRIVPNPPRAGQSVHLHAVVRDSLDRTIRYTWFLPTGPGEPPPGNTVVTTDTAGVRWTLPAQAGRYRVLLQIYRERGPGLGFGRYFYLDVAQ